MMEVAGEKGRRKLDRYKGQFVVSWRKYVHVYQSTYVMIPSLSLYELLRQDISSSRQAGRRGALG
jgi:hypothetical protein